MRLQIVTPLEIMVDEEAVSVHAEDATGSFAIWPHHADFITNLTVSVVGWRTPAGEERNVAVRGGLLRVDRRGRVHIATRQAVAGTTLSELGPAVLDRLRQEADAEAKSRVSSARLHLGLIRQLDRYLRAGRGYFPRAGGGPAAAREEAAEEAFDER